MKRKLTHLVLTALAGLALNLPAQAGERTQYLGVVNGQVVGNSVVKVTRTLPEPVLFLADSRGTLPSQLTVRDAEVRPASGEMAYITVKQLLPSGGGTARITLKTSLMVDGKKVALTARQQGEDVLVSVPQATQRVELRTDALAELEVPASYRGNLQIALQVEG
ncbi:fimbrial protein [Salmonella enterica subsp. enterica serovar Newport]|nr:fimbrial protein [Salmonella enterica subsp. enterica serovar Newport]EBS2390933.1 fimbrial protein [Salmonella enterica subsp. enterica serovar Newport]ECA8783283.1 fimbrial protein [Salmonella enterica subsp. enterica serovar Newport]ECD2007388.1 fimbrial protein [Salmonella enterica subsp. enterica serovar Newport]EDQ9772401.1 fimbrial protein [Salmonella enterica subsp. salamae]